MNNIQRRIVCLVPSLTETLVSWGLRDEIVGCTKFCISPHDIYKSATIVGGTKDFEVEKIWALQPTHIVCNQEENPKELVEKLQTKNQIYLCFPKGPEDVPEMLRSLGSYLNCVEYSEPIAHKVETLLANIRLKSNSSSQKSFLYFIWRQPYMIAGQDTYISRLIELAGWSNEYRGPERYPVVEPQTIQSRDSLAVLFSSEPFPFKRRHAKEFHQVAAGVNQVWKVDGQLLSWYGVRTLEVLAILDKNGPEALLLREDLLKAKNLRQETLTPPEGCP